MILHSHTENDFEDGHSFKKLHLLNLCSLVLPFHWFNVIHFYWWPLTQIVVELYFKLQIASF